MHFTYPLHKKLEYCLMLLPILFGIVLIVWLVVEIRPYWYTGGLVLFVLIFWLPQVFLASRGVYIMSSYVVSPEAIEQRMLGRTIFRTTWTDIRNVLATRSLFFLNLQHTKPEESPSARWRVLVTRDGRFCIIAKHIQPREAFVQAIQQYNPTFAPWDAKDARNAFIRILR